MTDIQIEKFLSTILENTSTSTSKSKSTKAKAIAVAEVVDALGTLKAKMADLSKQETALKKIILNSGLYEIDGSLFRATVSKFIKTTLDTDKARSYLTDKQLAFCQNNTEVTTIRLNARVKD